MLVVVLVGYVTRKLRVRKQTKICHTKTLDMYSPDLRPEVASALWVQNSGPIHDRKIAKHDCGCCAGELLKIVFIKFTKTSHVWLKRLRKWSVVLGPRKSTSEKYTPRDWMSVLGAIGPGFLRTDTKERAGGDLLKLDVQTGAIGPSCDWHGIFRLEYSVFSVDQSWVSFPRSHEPQGERNFLLYIPSAPLFNSIIQY